MRRLLPSLPWLALVTLALALNACGSSSGSGQDEWGYTFDDADQQDDSDASGGKDLAFSDGDELPEFDGPGCHMFFLVAEQDQTLYFTVSQFQDISIEVLTVSGNDVVPNAEEMVSCVLKPVVEGQGDASISPQFAYTDEQGVARIKVKTGTQSDVDYVLTCNTTGCPAPPITQKIHVSDSPKGDLVIDLVTDSTFPLVLNTIKVRLLPNDTPCDSSMATIPDLPSLAEYQVAGIQGTDNVTFQNLPIGQKYVVMATAKGPSGHLAAWGCRKNLSADKENGKTLEEVELVMLTLKPAGCYDSTSQMDFTGAIPGQVGEIVNLMVQLFYSPAEFIYNTIMELVAAYFGTFWADIADTVLSPFKNYLFNLVNDWLLNNSPDWLQCFFQVGQDVVQIVANIELTGQIKLTKLGNDWTIQGEETWNGLNLYWHLGCSQTGPCKGFNFNPLEGVCNYDSEHDACKCPVSMTALQDTNLPMDIIKGVFYGQIANFDNLIIQQHKVEINYGKLIMWVINDLIIPAVTGGQYHSLEDAIKAVIDCQGIANGMLGDLLDAIGLDRDILKDACDGAVTIFVDPIEEIIGALKLDSSIRLQGSCTMVDTDDNLTVDKLINGVWLGTIEVDGEQGPEFEGEFSAVRAQCQ
jgi:hypothetical protein